ncbi:hypothetical protein [Mycobacterium asiaticum]|uniref:Uncharacterized protein n=1 Tax=Mycobacterium asiaticum TaxID=1790 RepID=A0A1A3NHV6_MYCAS|nr:hypothetical protein [Mycobacterium asiaticum]OBK19977.1 hypothetical protein A5635_02105 [Mycobacterium asiaticum]
MGLFGQKATGARSGAAGPAKQTPREFPQRRAIQAFDRGEEFFQIQLPHAADVGATLGLVEQAGWRLEHADWVATDEVVGIYLFRRDEAREDRATTPEPAEENAAEPDHADVPTEVSAEASAETPAEVPAEKKTKVRCHACRHVHSVSVNETSFVCPNCNARLKRKKA